MPTYYFTCECGTTQHRVSSISKMKKRVKCLCGRYAPRDIAAEQRTVAHRPGNWPRLSRALGVMPDQIQEARAEHQRAGVPLEFHRSGKAIVTSPRHQREVVKKMGLTDSGSYF